MQNVSPMIDGKSFGSIHSSGSDGVLVDENGSTLMADDDRDDSTGPSMRRHVDEMLLACYCKPNRLPVVRLVLPSLLASGRTSFKEDRQKVGRENTFRPTLVSRREEKKRRVCG